VADSNNDNVISKDQVFVITGSGQGLGKAFAIRLLEAGARVCLSDVTQELGCQAFVELRERFGEDRVCLVACDVTKEDEFSNLLDEAEKFFNVDCIDVLANNAGIFTHLGWRKCLEVNLVGMMIGTELAMARMRGKPGRGHQIINTASIASFGVIGEDSSEECAAYVVSKFGALALTRSMAMDFSKHGVAVKCICPDMSDTAMVKDVMQVANDSFVSMIKKAIDSHTCNTPANVAEAFYRLVTQCNNGAAVYVGHGVPYMEMPDFNMVPMFLILTNLAKLVDKVARPGVVKTNHHIMAAAALFCLLLLLVAWIF